MGKGVGRHKHQVKLFCTLFFVTLVYSCRSEEKEASTIPLNGPFDVENHIWWRVITMKMCRPALMMDGPDVS